MASARYGLLVSQLHHLQREPQILSLTDLLSTLFKQPTKWLPENVGSVLLLLGQASTKRFLKSICSADEVAHAFTGLALMTARFRRPFISLFHRLDEVVECAEEEQERDAVFTAIWRSLTQVGLIPSVALFLYVDVHTRICKSYVPIKQLINLLVWIRKCASSELLNKQGKTGRKRVGCTSSRWSIRSWIEMVHGYIYLLNELLNLTQVVKEVGKRMMEKAYMGEPSRQSGSLSNEE